MGRRTHGYKTLGECEFCGTPLRPIVKYKHDEFGMVTDTPDGVSGYGYAAMGNFCTLRCGWAWAQRELRNRK